MQRDEDGILWALVYCKPLQEPIARMNLEDQGYAFLWLHYQATVAHAGRKLNVLRGYYPGYAYVGADEGQSLIDVRYAKGVRDLVQIGGETAYVPPAVIAAERARCLNNGGLVERPDSATQRRRFQAGAAVRTPNDAWAGYVAMVASDDGKTVGIWREAFGKKWVAYYTPEEVEPC